MNFVNKSQSPRLTGKEDRDLRDAVRRVMEGELRVRLISELLKRGLGFKEIEEFVCNEDRKKKCVEGGKVNDILYLRKGSKPKHREIVEKLMREKLRDAQKDCVNLRRTKSECLRILKSRIEDKKVVDKILKEAKANVDR